MKPIIDEVIKEIKNYNSDKEEWYDFEKVELAINNVCNRNNLRIKQLYIEVLELNRTLTFIPFLLTLFAIWLSFVAISLSTISFFKIEFSYNKILIIFELIVTIFIGYFCFIIPLKDYKKRRYCDSIMFILKKNNKKILGV